MRKNRMRFTIRSLLVAVMVLGAILGAAITTSRFYPREHAVAYGWGDGWSSTEFDGHGNSLIYTVDRSRRSGRGVTRDDRKLIRVEKRPPPPSLFQVWAPVIGAGAFTVLVLLVPWRSQRIGDRTAASPDRGAHTRWSWRARWATIIAATVNLAVAAAVYRPPPRRDDAWHRPLNLGLVAGDYWRVYGDYLQTADHPSIYREISYSRETGRVIERMSAENQRPARFALEDSTFQTIVYNIDGGVSGYKGKPGETSSHPQMLRPPTEPMVEFWWPVALAAVITLAVAAAALRASSWWSRMVCSRLLRRVSGGSIKLVGTSVSLRAASIVILLIAVNLAGAISTRRYARDQRLAMTTPTGHADGLLRNADGDIFYEYGSSKHDLLPIKDRPSAPSLIQVWSPVLTSGSLSVLLIVVGVGLRAPSTATMPSVDGSHGSRKGHHRIRRAQWALIAAGLIGLNVACALYRPRWNPADSWRYPVSARTYRPTMVEIVPSADIAFLEKAWYSSDGEFVSRSTLVKSSTTRGPQPFEDRGSAIIEMLDGSAFGYEATSGDPDPRLFVIKEPQRSLLERRWPVFAGGVATLLVLVTVAWNAMKAPQ